MDLEFKVKITIVGIPDSVELDKDHLENILEEHCQDFIDNYIVSDEYGIAQQLIVTLKG